MPDTISVEWEDIAPKLEEAEFMKEKAAKLGNKTMQTGAPNNSGNGTSGSQTTPSNYESIGLSDMVSEIWNEVAVEKGYEPVNEKQKEFLNRHTARVEEKYLKDRMNMLPEIESALAHFTVYVPKWLKYRRQHKGDNKE